LCDPLTAAYEFSHYRHVASDRFGHFMLHGAHTSGRSASLINDYASLLGEAVLRHRTRTAEHAARIEAELASRVKSEFIANMSDRILGQPAVAAEHAS
jgi:hypothetical protein